MKQELLLGVTKVQASFALIRYARATTASIGSHRLKTPAAKTMLARFLVLPATLLWTTDAFQPPQKRRLPTTRRLAPEEASVAVQAYADKAASAIAAAVAGADASLLASTGFTLAQAGIVVAAAALGAAAMRLFNREERKEMKTTRDEAVAKATELEAVWKSIEQTQQRRQHRVDGWGARNLISTQVGRTSKESGERLF